jgi:hypothetical protein
MQELIVFIKRSLLIWLLLIASITSFDAWLVLASVYSGSTGELRVGIPYAYYVQEPLDPWSEGDPSDADAVETEALRVNVAAMGVIALVSTTFWPLRSPSNAPPTPMPSPLGASARPVDAVKPDERAVAELDRRSRRCLRRTIVGSVVGLGLIFGALGWLRGKALHAAYERLGRSAPWTATAAWAVGRGLVYSTLIGILGMAFVR